MRRAIAVALVGTIPVLVSATIQVPQRGGGVLQDEAPIRVRNGSVDIQTLDGTKWVADGSQWSQDRESPGVATPMAEVRFAGGGTCTLEGSTITVKYKTSTATRTLRVHRTSRKLKVTPKADFDLADPQNATVLRSKVGAFVTEVTASGTGRASCDLAKTDELIAVCIATSESGLASCRSSNP